MTPWGFRSLAGGPFEQLTPEQFTALGWVLIGVCAADVVAGTWLWQARRRGAILALATSPVALGLGVGFALPFLLAGVPIGAALVLRGRSKPPIAQATLDQLHVKVPVHSKPMDDERWEPGMPVLDRQAARAEPARPHRDRELPPSLQGAAAALRPRDGARRRSSGTTSTSASSR